MSRPSYADLPAPVKDWVTATLGSPVVTAHSQPGGFSPGVAARVICASGRRAFVKAASAAVNADTPGMHRAEAHNTRLLPAAAGAPELLGCYDEDGCVALIFEEVAGRPPHLPWSDDDLGAALRALDRLSDVPGPGGLPSAEQRLGDTFGRWALLAVDPPHDLLPWQRAHLADLVAMEAGWQQAVRGDRLLHVDARSDNMLVRLDGEVTLIDWPHAATGAAVLDVIGFLPSAVLEGAGDPDGLLLRTRAGGEADADLVTTLVACMCGYLEHSARKPAPPGIGTVRAFQAAQARAAGDWLRRRTGW